jgi:hypothetical protein
MKTSRVALLFVFLLLPLISAIQLTLRPPRLGIQAEPSSQICKNITVSSDKQMNVSVQDSWANFKSKDLNDYNLTSESLDLTVDYQKTFFIPPGLEVPAEICFTAKRSGIFYGTVVFQSENSCASIGTWVELNISKARFSLTGKFAEKLAKSKPALAGLSVLLLLQIAILFFLIRKFRRLGSYARLKGLSRKAC